jgi:hypothetical protein
MTKKKDVVALAFLAQKHRVLSKSFSVKLCGYLNVVGLKRWQKNHFLHKPSLMNELDN